MLFSRKMTFCYSCLYTTPKSPNWRASWRVENLKRIINEKKDRRTYWFPPCLLVKPIRKARVYETEKMVTFGGFMTFDVEYF